MDCFYLMFISKKNLLSLNQQVTLPSNDVKYTLINGLIHIKIIKS